MKVLLTRQAFEAYQSGNYTLALNIYRQLACQLGEAYFSVNIAMCKKRIKPNRFDEAALNIRTENESPTSSATFLSDKTISADQSSITTMVRPKGALPTFALLENRQTDQRLVLSDTPIWSELRIEEVDYALISVDVCYEHVPQGNGRKAVAVLEYYDALGGLLPGPYPGLVCSDAVGWFCYLPPPSVGKATFSLKPPLGSVRVRIGFRSFFAKEPERVTLSSKVALKWHDNAPSLIEENASDDALPTLAVLPFETTSPLIAKKLTVASVLDPFSHACFSPECDLVAITPSRWRDELIDRRIDFLLVESAWHGNGDTWQYRVANYPSPPGNELTEILQWARKFSVPTVFWNKEDPPNFDRFIDRAKQFDFIFTTDENCVERYRKHVSDSTYVGVLPFAAQPNIHNPLLAKPRWSSTSFAGTYYADDFKPRRDAMDMLLRVAARYRLDIFDRMYGAAGKDKERFSFPPDLQPYVRGSLTYSEVLSAYRQYRVGLNVNSVSDSPTMFSRRVFELLACGTPVVSTTSTGIDRMFKGLVPTVESEVEAVATFKALMEDTAFWLETSVRGLRTVFKEHTYRHRLQTLVAAIGINVSQGLNREPIVVVFPNGNASDFVSSMKHQDVAPATVIVVGARYGDETSQCHQNELRTAGISAIVLPEANVATYVRHRHANSVVAVCDSRNYYGPGYLLDALISLEGTQDFPASTMLESRTARQAMSNDFGTVASLGMPCQSICLPTLVARPHSQVLIDAVTKWRGMDVVEIDTVQVRTRASFDFVHYKALWDGFAAGKTDLR